MGRDDFVSFGISPRRIRTIISHLKRLSEIAVRSTKRGSIITILKYDIYIKPLNTNDQEIDHQPTINRPSTDHSKGSKGSRGSELKAVPSPSGDGVEACPKEPPEAPPPARPSRRKRVPSVKTPTDPQINPKPFLEEIEKAGTLVTWAKDMATLQRLMQSRDRAGVPDVPTEVWSMWKAFKAGAVDGDYRMDDGKSQRPHDISSFCMMYSALMEGSNGRPPKPDPAQREEEEFLKRFSARVEARKKKGVEDAASRVRDKIPRPM